MSAEITRREFLAVAAVAAAASVSTPVAAATVPAALVVYDSRMPGSRHFARLAQAAGGVPLYDIAGAHADSWRAARAGFDLAAGATLVGMTRWSDWVSLRGILMERGLRVRLERRCECGTLFEWRMS